MEDDLSAGGGDDSSIELPQSDEDDAPPPKKKNKGGRPRRTIKKTENKSEEMRCKRESSCPVCFLELYCFLNRGSFPQMARIYKLDNPRIPKYPNA
jgi:hypothetical protein